MDLPDFDHLVALAEKHPEKLEALRHRYNRHLIDAAPNYLKRRLEGLLFKINMEKRRSKNPTQSCIKMSELMMDSFVDMQTAIGRLKLSRASERVTPSVDLNNVIFFPVKDELVEV